MTLNSSISENDDRSPAPLDTHAYRQLIQQFYESSILTVWRGQRAVPDV